MTKTLKHIYSGVDQSDPNRNKNDLYRTPPLATYILCKYTKVPKKIVEPCAGFGNIAIELERNGHTLHCSDLNYYKEALLPIKTSYDAMLLPKIEDYDGVVTNPPYHKDLPRKLAEKFVAEYDYVAFFVRLTFLEGMKRYKLFTNNPPSDIIILSDRVNFGSKEIEPVNLEEQIDGMISYMWVIWNKKAEHTDTKLQWVLLKDEYPEWREQYDAWLKSK
jgi:hypothetical protein